jgi:hypothetical protein
MSLGSPAEIIAFTRVLAWDPRLQRLAVMATTVTGAAVNATRP